MATRRDQLHSYQFLNQRVISAFLMRETDPRQSPLRRGVGAVFAGLMVAILVGAGFGVYGILTKVGSDAWKAEGSVIIEKETGATFVYFDDVLHPTLNYASALLAAGRPNPVVSRVASNSLSSVPRGTTVGIPGAPTSLPATDRRVGLPWTVCAIPGTDNSGQATTTTMLAVSVSPDGGASLSGNGVLVVDARAGATHLVWHGRRYLIREPETVVPALFGAVSAVSVGTAWLNALPAGADIAIISVPDRGTPSSAVPGRAVGDILTAQTGSGPQHYLVFSDGLAPITELQKTVLGAKFAVRPQDVAVAQVNAVPRSSRLVRSGGDAQPPAAPPRLVQPGGGDQVCAVTADAKAAPAVSVGGTLPGADGATPTTSTSADGVPLADRVLVPAGRVATVRVLGAPTAASGPLYVITDLGIRYAVPRADVFTMLGYREDQVIDVPASLVARIPSGPVLDPGAAVEPVSAGSGS